MLRSLSGGAAGIWTPEVEAEAAEGTSEHTCEHYGEDHCGIVCSEQHVNWSGRGGMQ